MTNNHITLTGEKAYSLLVKSILWRYLWGLRTALMRRFPALMSQFAALV